MDPLSYMRKNWVELLVAGVWLQSVVGAALARDWTVLAFTGIGGLLLTLVVFILMRISEWRRKPLSAGPGFAVSRKALILTVGGQKDTANFVIRNQKPQYLGLICSWRTEHVADEIVNSCGIQRDNIQKEIVDPWEVLDSRDKVDTLLRWLARNGVGSHEIAVDFTGGTSPMSAGTFAAADAAGVDTQYVRSSYDENNRVIPDTQECILISRIPNHGKPAAEIKKG